MSAVTSWSAAFKEVHGKTPTKKDFGFAPDTVKNEYYASCPKSPTKKVKQVSKKPIGVSIKRRAPEEWSPVKRPVKRVPKPLEIEENIPSLPMIHPILKQPTLLTNKTVSIPSPLKNVSFSPLKSIRTIPSHKSPSRIQPPRSPLKRLLTHNTASPFRSLFDTPEKGAASPLSSLVTSKSATKTPPRSPGRSLKSPRKPIQREIIIKNVDQMLMPTPEKKQPEEITDPFQDEEVPEAVAKAKYRKPGMRKKTDDNFVRINMRKKAFVRGKVSAEQKRKMLRKMKWKKRAGPG